MNTATRVQILDETDCISHSTNRYESKYSPSSYGQIVGQTRFFSLGEATSLGEGKLWIQTCYTPLKSWPCVISCLSGGVGKKRRCPWCNGYRHRNWTRRHGFKSWTDCISHSNSEFKPVKPVDLVSYPARAEGLGKYERTFWLFSGEKFTETFQ